jgi:hypothetical protein
VKVALEHVHPAHTEICQRQLVTGGVSAGNPNQRGSSEIVPGLGQVTRRGFEVSKVFVYTGDFRHLGYRLGRWGGVLTKGAVMGKVLSTNFQSCLPRVSTIRKPVQIKEA